MLASSPDVARTSSPWLERLIESPSSRSRTIRRAARIALPALLTVYSTWYDALAAGRAPAWTEVALFAVTGSSLVIARRAPIVPSALALLCWAVTESCSFVVVMSSVVAERRPRWWWAALLVFLAVHPLGFVPTPCAYRAGHVTLPEATAPLLGVALPAALGAVVGETRRVVAAREQRLRAEIDRATAVAETAAIEERLRMSRDVHDLVGRSLSRVALHAAAIEATTKEPRTAELAARTSRAAAQAVADLRYVVGVLRAAASAPVSARLLRDEVDDARHRGHPVHLEGTGVLGQLDDAPRAALEAAGAEGVHNALKHAPGAAVRVTVAPVGDRVVLRVTSGPVSAPAPGTDDTAPGPGGAAAPSLGHGLAIAAERLAAVGGSLTAGPSEEGFDLRAEVPR
ncbi:sensor histidine kinase [Curtobacterium sp. MCSS17_008]|uniref:sensor histidine kinase n=1 Tax=Curtobacterium sp. MCSS17_008 TaxID=2175647 RepID=UPI0015E89835|nr:histidine kinase [Curtobacterium sp. MCSS17_008]